MDGELADQPEPGVEIEPAELIVPTVEEIEAEGLIRPVAKVAPSPRRKRRPVRRRGRARH